MLTLKLLMVVAVTSWTPLDSVEAFAVPMTRPRVSSTLFSTIDSGIELAQNVQPSVALVTPIGVRNMKARGSGFVVDFTPADGEDNDKYTYLITAAHVAAPGYDIGLVFPGETSNFTAKATVIGRNQTLDLALLRIDKDKDRTPLAIATDLPPVGTTAFAHGYPASRLRGPAMTMGIVCGVADGLGMPEDESINVTGTGGMFDNTTFVVTDAAMSGGMSGGPLTDSLGRVLGVTALIRPDLRALGNYAVSSQEVNSFLNSITIRKENNTEPQSSYQVLLFNDPMNKRQRVSSLLQKVAKLNEEKANEVMMQAHTTGIGVINEFESRTAAEQLRQALREGDLLVEVQ